MKAALPTHNGIQHLFDATPHFSFREKLAYKAWQTSRQLVEFAKFSYIALVLILLLCSVIELKHIFNVDIFPGVDTPFDNAYYAGKAELGDNTL